MVAPRFSRALRSTCWVLVLPWLLGCQIATIRPIESETHGDAGAQAFNATSYVDDIWQSKVLPAAEQQSTELPTLLAAIASDQAKAEQQYGHREPGRPASFLVRGAGRVLNVDTTSRNGVLLLDIAPFDQQPDVTLQIGPVLRGTAVRDAVGFIQFNQFVNQLQYADVAKALNARVLADVLTPMPSASLTGQTITFQGAFTLDTPGSIFITPLALAVEPAP